MRRVRCTKGCGQEMWAHSRPDHEKLYCKECKVTCEFCHISYKQMQMGDHLTMCIQAPEKCKNRHFGCTFTGASKMMFKHIEFACDFSFNRPCPLGCNMKLRNVDIEAHKKKCLRRESICEACGETIIFAQIEIHGKYECALRSVPCGQCGEIVPAMEIAQHRETNCHQRHAVCSNSGCYLTLPIIEMQEHVKLSCRRAVVYCKQGCGNTMFLEKRKMHENELCECRFVACPMCKTRVRDKDKMSHMEIECVRRTMH